MLNDFIAQCRDLVAGDEPVVAVRAAMDDLLTAHAHELADAYPAPTDSTSISGESNTLFEDDTLSVMTVHTPPGVAQPPHDHLMSVVIGGYAGVEQQRLFRRTPGSDVDIEFTGTKDIGRGDILVLGPQGVHAIDAAGPEWASAVHVYLGRLSATKRSLFHPDTFVEEPLTLDRYDTLCR